jgi:hypothetical protein
MENTISDKSDWIACEAPTHKGQTYLESLWEAKLNVLSGFVISWLVWVFIAGPLFDIPFNMFDSLGIVCIFTVSSLLRAFIIRRWFNHRSKI